MRDVSFVEAIARRFESLVPTLSLSAVLSFDELFQSAREIGVPENFTRFGRVALRKVDLYRRGIFQNLLRLCDVRGATLAQGETNFSQIDGGLQHLRKAHRAPAFEQDVPGIDHAGDASRKKSVAFGNLASVIFLIPLNGCELGGAR